MMMFLSIWFRMLSVPYIVVDLPGPRRPGDQDRAVGLVERGGVPFVGALEEPEVLETQEGVGRIQDPEHDLLAEHRGQCRDTQIDLLAADLHRDPAVLRDALLRDVEVGHHLHAADQTVLDVLRRRRHRLHQDAVDAETDPQIMLARFDMDVGGSVGHGLGHHRVDELDDRGIFDGGVEVALLVLLADASTMLAIASTPESMPEYFWIAASTSAAVATTGNTSRPVIVRIRRARRRSRGPTSRPGGGRRVRRSAGPGTGARGRRAAAPSRWCRSGSRRGRRTRARPARRAPERGRTP